MRWKWISKPTGSFGWSGRTGGGAQEEHHAFPRAAPMFAQGAPTAMVLPKKHVQNILWLRASRFSKRHPSCVSHSACCTLRFCVCSLFVFGRAAFLMLGTWLTALEQDMHSGGLFTILHAPLFRSCFGLCQRASVSRVKATLCKSLFGFFYIAVSRWHVRSLARPERIPFPPMAIASLLAVCQRCCTPLLNVSKWSLILV